MTEVNPPPPQQLPWSQLARGIGMGTGLMLFRNLCFAVVLANIAMFGKAMFIHAYTPDLPWLLQSGQYMLEHGMIPTHDVFSWTHPDKPWVLYQWLFEVLVAWGQNLWGIDTLVRLFALFVLTLYVGVPFLMSIRRNIPLLFTLVIGSSALYLAAINMSLRPMLVTTLFMGVQYILLQRYRYGGLSTWKLFVTVALIYLLWGNLHTGVSLGFWSLMLFMAGDFLQRRGWYVYEPPPSEGAAKPQRLSLYAALMATAFLASVANPYGIDIYHYLANLSAQKDLNEAIIELQSPNFHFMNYWYFAALFVVFILLMMHARRVFSAQEMLHLLVFTLATLFVQRFVVWAALLYAFILPRALNRWYLMHRYPLLERLVTGFEVYKPLFVSVVSIMAVIVLFFPQVVPDNHLVVHRGICERFEKGIHAFHQLKTPADKVYMEPEIGSCTLAWYPEDKVFIDTRFDFYGQEFTRETRETLDLLGDWKGVLRKWDINMLFVSKRWPIATLLKASPDYATLYEDDDVLVFQQRI